MCGESNDIQEPFGGAFICSPARQIGAGFPVFSHDFLYCTLRWGVFERTTGRGPRRPRAGVLEFVVGLLVASVVLSYSTCFFNCVVII